MRQLLLLGTLSLGVVTTLMGCGTTGSGPPTASVSGTVYLDGAPAAGVEVHFISGTHNAFGRTDEDGKYELVAGAALGENKVYFSKFEGLQFELDAAAGMDEGQLLAMSDRSVHASRVPKQVIPAEFSDPAKTKVRYVVPASGANNVDFKLQGG